VCAWSFAATPPVCVVGEERASFAIRHVSGSPELTLDPDANVWRHAAVQYLSRDCTRQTDYPNLKTQIRAFWTDTDLYFLFRCPYDVLNLWPADNSKPHVNLWDRDVVEMFIGYDWQNIKHYREFEMAPTGDWIDLAIDLNRDSYDSNWRSGWKTMARIDKQTKTWYAAAKIPLSSIGGPKAEPGTRWRINLYRIDGLGADPQRHFLCWQPTCVEHRDPNHVPEHFGTLAFQR